MKKRFKLGMLVSIISMLILSTTVFAKETESTADIDYSSLPTSKLTFVVESQEIKDNHDSIIIIYSGDNTDALFVLNEENGYKDTQELPKGEYTLMETFSSRGFEYTYIQDEKIDLNKNKKVKLDTLNGVTEDELKYMYEYSRGEFEEEENTYFLITGVILLVICIPVTIIFINKKKKKSKESKEKEETINVFELAENAKKKEATPKSDPEPIDESIEDVIVTPENEIPNE